MNIQALLKQPEGRRLEFKEKLPTKADLCKTIISFANDAGGVLYIGIKDSSREIVGLPEDDIIQTEEQISNLVFDNCYPIIIPEISILNINDKLILKVQIYSGSNTPYYLKQKGKTKGTYLRIGSSNRLANEELIIEMERHKRNISFDSELILEFFYKTLNLDRFHTLYYEKTGELCDEISLKKLKVLKEYNGE